ncbi:MAG: type IV pili methyl-accepting chemotaxis transducer N-terminal domain-containing protein [Rhodospirillum sp.]|nr:type IV pili methyl-accepting chemotaxis transducer N-terminal domain-containing protein [Rhodospirillum sp.]
MVSDPPSPPKSAPPLAAPSAWMTRRYGLALAVIALLALSAYGSFELLIAQHERTLAVVNVSGRQRMLSQRSTLFAERLVMGHCPRALEASRAALGEAVDLFETSHQGLTRGSAALNLPDEMSEVVSALYFTGTPSLNDRITAFIANLRVILTSPAPGLDDPTVAEAYRRVVADSSGPLLTDLDELVFVYQKEGEATFTRLHRLETGVLALTLATLLLEVLLIFRPMVGHIRGQFEQLNRMTQALRASKDTLEEQVARRTGEIDQARREAVRANISKSKFLAAAGHDLLQPLEAAVMYTGMIGRAAESEKTKRAVAELKASHAAMSRLIRAVLELSKLEAGVVTPKPEPFTLGPLLETLAREFQATAGAKGLELRVVPTALSVETDPLLLERILRNLLSNALRYTQEGGVLLGVRHRSDGLVIQVWDTGVGIAEADRHRIFEEFTQLELEDRDRSEGLGLGLAIVDRLARLMGLDLSLRSTPGRGTVFSVHLPGCNCSRGWHKRVGLG